MFSKQLAKLIQFRYSGNVTKFSRNIGKRESVVRNWMQGAQPRLADLLLVSDAEAISLDWLTRGIGADPPDVAPDHFPVAERFRRVMGEKDANVLASRLDLPHATLEAIATGAVCPDADALARIARRINVHWLVTGNGPLAPPGAGERSVLPVPDAEQLLAHVISNERGEFSDDIRAAAADEIQRVLKQRISRNGEKRKDAPDEDEAPATPEKKQPGDY